MQIPVIHADRHLVIVNKPSGLDVHGRSPEDPDTLVALVARQLRLSPRRLHPASRLDKPVTGILPLARSKIGRKSLTEQYQRREIKRTYVALTLGLPDPAQGSWDQPIGPGRRGRRQALSPGAPNAVPACTSYQVTQSWPNGVSLVVLRPATGRTHQLRVHLSQVGGCPILGDRRYGGPPTLTLPSGEVVALSRVMLHAAALRLTHPESGQEMYLEAPHWPDFQGLLDRFSS